MATDMEVQENFENHNPDGNNATANGDGTEGEMHLTSEKPVSIFDLDLKPPPGFQARIPT